MVMSRTLQLPGHWLQASTRLGAGGLWLADLRSSKYIASTRVHSVGASAAASRISAQPDLSPLQLQGHCAGESVAGHAMTPRNEIQETALLVQNVLRLRFQVRGIPADPSRSGLPVLPLLADQWEACTVTPRGKGSPSSTLSVVRLSLIRLGLTEPELARPLLHVP
eukprot:3941875-Rhodomonas_salina.2